MHVTRNKKNGRQTEEQTGTAGGDGGDAGAGGDGPTRVDDGGGAGDASDGEAGAAAAGMGTATGSAGDVGCLPGDDLVPWAGVCTQKAYLGSIDLIVGVARATRNDKLLRTMLQMKQQSTKKRAVEETAASIALKAAAKADREQELKRRSAQRQEEHDKALAAIAAKTALQKSRSETAESRRHCLETARLAKVEADQRKKVAIESRAEASWLQEQFPLFLAKKLNEWRKGCAYAPKR